MAHMEPLQASSLDIYPLSSSSSRQAIAVFTQLFSTCVGPHGKNHIVRNACGGHLTITSSCSRLLSSISFSRSEMKMLVSAVTGHLQQHADCGLFMTHVCMQLTKSVLDMNISHNIASSTFLTFVSLIVDYVKSDTCAIRIRADFSNIKPLLSYVQSIMSSKALLNIQSQELNNLSLTVLNAFVSAIPSLPSHRYSTGVFVLGQEKVPITECNCVDGMMIDFPELLSYGDPDDLIEVIQSKLDKDENDHTFARVALITCSMSGDVDDVVNATVEGTSQQFSDLDECVLQKLTSLYETLESQNVAIILCQKVIHPKFKALLRSKGILFVDRLGSQSIPFIRDLTGCMPITSPLQKIGGQTQFLGKLTSISPRIENKKSFLCLNNKYSSVVTLVVCSEWEERLSELKHCVSTCLKGLESLTREPWLLMGGGCWQMYCSEILKEKVLSTLPALCKKLSCSESTLKQLLAVFISCLHKWCLGLKHSTEHISLEPSSFHCWRASKNIPLSLSNKRMQACACGFKSLPLENLEDLDIMLTSGDFGFLSNKVRSSNNPNVIDVCEYDNVVLDNFIPCMEALHKGVLTAGLLMSVGQLICDRN